MGADEFTVGAKGKTAKEAFNTAVSEARYESGHGGYSGTIAEKDSFVFLGTRPNKKEAYAYAQTLMEDIDSRIEDKWGPAGCVAVEGTDFFLFFGWASS